MTGRTVEATALRGTSPRLNAPTLPAVTWIYEGEDLDPDEAEEFERDISARYGRLAGSRGLEFRVVRVAELVAAGLDRPALLHDGEDLLARRQCFILEDAATTPQGRDALRAVYRTIAASDSVLLNRSFAGPDYLERDKLAIVQYAARLGIPTPPTIAVPPGRYARRALRFTARMLGPGPYILKPRGMSGGTAVLRVESEQHLAAALDMVAQGAAGYLLQPLLPHTGDMRVYVADGKVVCSLTRRPRSGGYLASVSQGGRIEVNDDHLSVREYCEEIAASLGAEWLCVDWLMTGSGPILNEWSTAHGGFTMMPEPQVTQVADAFFGWILRRLRAAH